MTNREYFITQWEREAPTFLNVFKAVVEDKWDYRPDPVTKSAKELVQTLLAETEMYQTILEGEHIDVNHSSPRQELSLTDMTAQYEKKTETIIQTLKDMKEETWETQQTGFYMGDKPVFTSSIRDMMWMLLFDAVHHRGQLTTYIRIMGGKVPAIYGPSADDMGPMAEAIKKMQASV